MRFQKFSFGSIRIDGTTYEHEVVIDGGQIRKRKKKPSKKFRDAFGHTPLSVEEEIPWKCRRLVIGTGTGALPVMEEVKQEAKRRKIKLVVLPTAKAIEVLKKEPDKTRSSLERRMSNGLFLGIEGRRASDASLTDYVTESLVEYVTVFPNRST